MKEFKLNKTGWLGEDNGIQMVISLDCFDISVVRHKHSYGGADGLYELGVFWTDEPAYYINEIGDRREFVNQVKGWLDEEAVTDIVNRLMELNQSSNSLINNIRRVIA